MTGPLTSGQPVRLPVEVVIPLRWHAGRRSAEAVEEMRGYLRGLAALADVTVVDGSAPPEREAHQTAWGRWARIVPPGAREGANGKVVGALSGIDAARHELVVLADDDVRYDEASLRAVVAALGTSDVVRPQNVFTRWPWHARWDTARSLLARSVGADWPGTFGLRASAVRLMGGWDPDVLFENLEMVRTAEAAGCRVRNAPQIVIGRQPPSTRHFWSQRVRQAYDDLAQPARLAVELAILPGAVLAAWHRPRALLVAGAGLVAAAEVGRRRFRALDLPVDVPLWAPLWAAERGICVWLALASRLGGGMPYHGRRLRTAARPGPRHRPRRMRARPGGLRHTTRSPHDSATNAAVSAGYPFRAGRLPQ